MLSRTASLALIASALTLAPATGRTQDTSRTPGSRRVLLSPDDLLEHGDLS